MDMNERKAVSNPFVLERLPLEAKGVSVRVAGAVRPVGGNVSVRSMTPQYTDFDLNGHVNNASYADWL